MKEIKCIDNNGAELALTIGDTYTAVKEDNFVYHIDINGEICFFAKARFETINNEQ